MSDTSSLKDYWCPKKKITRMQQRAILRLLKDVRVVKDNPLPTVCAEPLHNDIFHWHGNLKGPAQSPLEGGIFHFSMTFDEHYPATPPQLSFFEEMPHPFVFSRSMCVSMLQHDTPQMYKGWSPIYTVYNILSQLQSFLIDGLEAVGNARTGYNIDFTQKQTSQWKIVFENRDEEGEGTLTPPEIRELLLEVGERKPSEEELALYYKMQHLPKGQAIDFSTFLAILKRKREYRKVVESFNRFSCNKCNHGPQQTFPNFVNIGPEKFVQNLPLEKLYALETECFFTKRSFQEPDSATLGIGISFFKNLRNGKIHKVFASRDLISLNAFRKYNANRVPDDSNSYTHWIPVYLNEKHGERAMHLLPRCLGIICTGSHRDFNPEMILEVVPKIVGGVVQQLANGSSHTAVRALYSYSQFFHLFLVYMQRYPAIRKIIRSMILSFINDPSARNKEAIPSLSDFMALFFVIGTPEDEAKEEAPIDIKKLFAAVIEEINVRSVLWIVKKHPELDKSTPDEKIDANRINNSFECSKAGFQILLHHRFFYTNVACPATKTDLVGDYNSRLGRPSELQINNVIKEFERSKTLENYEEVFLRLGLEPPEEPALLSQLRAAVCTSTKYNYHCKRVITVQSADEYLKEKLKNFVALDDLIDEEASKKISEELNRKVFILKDDEATFRQLCQQRFGAMELPDVDPQISPLAHPWQHLYLKLNIEDMLCKFNENPDFKRFYRVLELSAYELRSLEFIVVPVTNVKSNFYYLTALLTNMFNLEKFTVRMGEISLDLKGCKALCKGLKNNQDSIRVLDLHYCHITSDRIKILEDGLLSSKKLISLNMEGNPIGDIGASSIAKVLRAHDKITHLNVNSCALTDAGAQVLANAFYHNQSLKIVRISRNRISTQGMSAIFQKLAYSRTIEQIDFLCNDTDGSASVAKDLTRLFEVSTSLDHINFYKTRCSPFFTAETFHGLAQNRSVSELDLGSSRLGSATITNLGWAVARNHNIRKLHLENSEIGPFGAQLLSEAIYDTQRAIESREKALKVRDLTATEIEEDLRPRGCNLELLNLSNNTFNIVEPLQCLALERLVALTTTIVDLNLSRCGLGVPAGEALGKGLRNHPSLTSLNLSGNKLEEYGVKKLCKGLHENSVLKTLDLARNSMSGRGASGVANLLSDPKCGIETLSLYGNFIGIEGARFIAASLESNATLTDLDIGLNRMRPKGVNAIALALQKNKTLKVLRLKQNFINDKAAMELGEVLQKQTSVTKLCVAGNQIKDAILNSIVASLKTCDVPVTIDVANLLEVTQRSRLQKTVYCTPLPLDISSNALKKMFYDGGCGAIVNVSILKHAQRDCYKKACYAFVEFAEEDSVQLALDIGSEGKAKIGKNIFSVIQAQGETASATARKQQRGGSRGGRGGSRGGSRGGRGGSRGGRNLVDFASWS
eukprot:CAMPEP_0117037982 /NCGR_PEP_ID=MMETSP0472-20121206/26760_1 /TAXON_ID=693140 ORGANISM="Tiarina fusus, Strain LIS" /NCGR_SAMPLE_ID=MMETSP0472 /ASSEMBLY_ACC=CAM_ASM_000603 /LENGTH=1428 /DNA_ID=CAMNT_0004748091 /DNA_START=29 /DNA_END=4315 /DNA_ORIENTATION=-